MADWSNVTTSMAPAGDQAVPVRPDELTPAFLTACLRHQGTLDAAARVVSVEQREIGQGRGFAGKIVRLSLGYEPAGAGPATMVGKFASEHGPTREMLLAVDGYVREVRFYRELARDVGVPTPRCYFAHYDAAHGRCCLLLEDLAPSASVDRVAGFSVEQAREVLEHLAAMHARFWNKQDEVPWLALHDDFIEAVRTRFLAGLPRFVEAWRTRFPEIAAAGQALVPFLEGDEMFSLARRPPLTLAHNDIHVDNVFVPTAQGGRLAVIDWQSVSFSRHGTTDVTRVLCVALRPELRRAHGRELLRAYHRALVANGVRGFSRFALGRRVREETVALVLIGVLAFDTLDFSTAGEETVALFGERIELAVREARLKWLLRAMGLWLRIKTAVRRALGLGAPRRLSG